MDSNGDQKTLYLICDTSGSMSENGKNMLMRGVARTVEQYIRLGYGAAGLKLVLWNSEAEQMDWNPDDEFPEQMILNCCGPTANARALCELLNAASDGLFLILTDGWWSREDALTLRKWKLLQTSGSLRIIKIGSDANPLLKGDDVFLPDDVFSVLEEWLPAAENSTASEDEDEW